VAESGDPGGSVILKGESAQVGQRHEITRVQGVERRAGEAEMKFRQVGTPSDEPVQVEGRIRTGEEGAVMEVEPS